MEDLPFQDKYYRSGGFKPGGWRIAPSPIHGNGIFTNNRYEKGEDIDLCFIRKSWTAKSPDQALIRTKFCAYVNHSEQANSELYQKGVMYILRAIEPIESGEEITCNYNEGLAYEISGGFHPSEN